MSEAIKWLQKASDQGSKEAKEVLLRCQNDNADYQFSMGKKYYEGEGMDQNYENAVEWLTMANLVSQIYRAEQIKKPLENYRDIDSFKIYLSDLGLLCAKKDIVPNDILYMVDELDDFKGGMAENYVNTQLVMNGFTTYYWESDRGAEVDFVIQLCGKLIPIEVKSADNVKAKSLKVYIETYKPDYAIKISAKNFGFENNIKTIPLYAVFCISNKENEK